MADIRINALATTAASTASDDFVAVDGSANGTRKLNAYSPTFGGNLAANGTGAFGGTVSVSTGAGGSGFSIIRTGASASTCTILNSGGEIISDYNGINFRWDLGGVTKLTLGSTTATLASNLTVSGTGNNIFNSGGGNLLIGTTTDGGQKLQVNGNAAITGNLNVRTALGYATGIHSGNTSDGSQQLMLTSTGAYNNGYINKTSTGLGIGLSSTNGSFTADDTITITAATKATTFAGAVTANGTGTFGSSFGKVIINQWSDATNYGAITLNGNTTVAGSLGIGGGASGDSNLYFNAPTGGTIQSRINGTSALTLTSTAATFTGNIGAGGVNPVVAYSSGGSFYGSGANPQVRLVATSTGGWAFSTYTNVSATGNWSAGLQATGQTYRITNDLDLNGTAALSIAPTTLATTFGGTISTSAPTGGAGAWELGVYTATAPTATGYVTIEIGGTQYKLLAATA